MQYQQAHLDGQPPLPGLPPDSQVLQFRLSRS